MNKSIFIFSIVILIFLISPVFSYSPFMDNLLNSGSKIVGNALFDDKGNFQSGDILVGDSQSDIGNLISPDLNNADISAKDVEVSKSSGITKITFDNQQSLVNINGNSFENIAPQSKTKNPTYLNLDGKGEVIEADFTTNEKGGDYFLGGNKFHLPANSRVYYSKDKGLNLPKDSAILNSPTSGLVSGENIKLANGDFISGNWKYSNGNMLISSGEQINLNGLEITNTKNSNKNDLSVFFDGLKHSGRSISLGDKNLFISSPDYEGPLVEFTKDNPYIKIEDTDYTALKLGKDSEIAIQNRDLSGLIPKMDVKGDFILDDGSKSLNYNQGKLYLSRYSELSSGKESSTTSPLDIFSPDKRIIVDNSNKWGFDIPKNAEAYLTDKNSLNPIRFSSKLDYNYNNPDFGLSVFDRSSLIKYQYSGEYVDGARITLDKALQEKYPNVDFDSIKKSAEPVTNSELNKYVQTLQDYYLTPQERDSALKGTGFENYPGAITDLKKIFSQFSLGETKGTLEGDVSPVDEKYGMNNMLYKWYSPKQDNGKLRYYYYNSDFNK